MFALPIEYLELTGPDLKFKNTDKGSINNETTLVYNDNHSCTHFKPNWA
jgi:hypothetical protein